MSRNFGLSELRVKSNLPFVLLLSILLGSCQTIQQGSYLGNCGKAGAVGALLAGGWKAYTGGSKTEVLKTAAIGGVGGCVVGLAATAIGNHLNESEREKHDEAFQKASQTGANRMAEERQRIEQRYQTMAPPTDETTRTKRQREKEAEVKKVVIENPTEETWKSNAGEPPAEGKVFVVGAADIEGENPSGGANCMKVKEWVVKDGKEVSQTSNACQDENGKWVRFTT